MNALSDQTGNDIPLDVAKGIILTALRDFDPQLGARATRILLDPQRCNIFETYGPRRMEQCRPVGLDEAYLRANSMWRDDYTEVFGPQFTEQTNVDGPHAIIDFEYDFTADAVSYLAHELGHAIADEIQQQRGLSFRDFSGNELEEQAYLVQSIVSAAFNPDFNEQSSRKENASQTLSDDFNRAGARYNAHTFYEQACQLSGAARSNFIMQKLCSDAPMDKAHNPAPPETAIKNEINL